MITKTILLLDTSLNQIYYKECHCYPNNEKKINYKLTVFKPTSQVTLQDKAVTWIPEGPSQERVSCGKAQEQQTGAMCVGKKISWNWNCKLESRCAVNLSAWSTWHRKAQGRLQALSTGRYRAFPGNTGSQAGDWRELGNEQQGCDWGQASVWGSLFQAGCWPAEMAKRWQHSPNAVMSLQHWPHPETMRNITF